MDIGDGEQFSFVKKIIPDVRFVLEDGVSADAALNIVLKRRNEPLESLTTDTTTQVKASAPFTNLRTRARQLVFRFESDEDATDSLGYKWRLGDSRIEIQPSGRR